MTIKLKRRTPESRTEDIVVTWEEVLAEEEAERLQLHLDLESGRLTEEEMMRQNCIDWGDMSRFTLHKGPALAQGKTGKREHGKV